MMGVCKPRILLVDDDPAIVELLGIVLEISGYEVLTAGDGAQAVAILQNTAPDWPVDILMVDLMMPVMDGLRFMHWLRTDLKCTLPVLVLTGMNRPSEMQRALDAGADVVLSKPIEPMIIVEKLAQLLGRSGAGGHVAE